MTEKRAPVDSVLSKSPEQQRKLFLETVSKAVTALEKQDFFTQDLTEVILPIYLEWEESKAIVIMPY